MTPVSSFLLFSGAPKWTLLKNDDLGLIKVCLHNYRGFLWSSVVRQNLSRRREDSFFFAHFFWPCYCTCITEMTTFKPIVYKMYKNILLRQTRSGCQIFGPDSEWFFINIKINNLNVTFFDLTCCQIYPENRIKVLFAFCSGWKAGLYLSGEF